MRLRDVWHRSPPPPLEAVEPPGAFPDRPGRVLGVQNGDRVLLFLRSGIYPGRVIGLIPHHGGRFDIALDDGRKFWSVDREFFSLAAGD